MNSNGETIRALGVKDPTAGDDLHLTIDLRIQRAAERQLREGLVRARAGTDSNHRSLQANAGAVIVMDAQTGAIKAMASLPNYDPRWFVQGLTKSEANYLYKSAAEAARRCFLQAGSKLSYPWTSFLKCSGLCSGSLCFVH